MSKVGPSQNENLFKQKLRIEQSMMNINKKRKVSTQITEMTNVANLLMKPFKNEKEQESDNSKLDSSQLDSSRQLDSKSQSQNRRSGSNITSEIESSDILDTDE